MYFIIDFIAGLQLLNSQLFLSQLCPAFDSPIVEICNVGLQAGKFCLNGIQLSIYL